VAEKPLSYRAIKRTFDILMSLLVIVIGLIPGLILSAVIVCETKSSPIYTQERIGKGGKPFRIYKFRTMVGDSDDVEKYLNERQLEQWHRERKVDDDPRITKLGRVLRATSLDETANFLNVFLGHMSIVGPRAIVQEELEQFGDDMDLLLSVPCGITGWWQVTDRNAATFESGRRQELELYYVRNASLALDLKIIARTFGAMLDRTGK
jgi:lipopolysaccharide/colanic/teichoic acid biosynthesis glycosyltransferase